MWIEQIDITTNSGGSASGTSKAPLCGRVVQIRMPNAGTALGGTADYTFTRTVDGGTILVLTDGSAPWQHQPRNAIVTTTGGTTSAGLGVGPFYDDSGIPIDGYLAWTVVQATASATATVYVYVDDD